MEYAKFFLKPHNDDAVSKSQQEPNKFPDFATRMLQCNYSVEIIFARLRNPHLQRYSQLVIEDQVHLTSHTLYPEGQVRPHQNHGLLTRESNPTPYLNRYCTRNVVLNGLQQMMPRENEIRVAQVEFLN